MKTRTAFLITLVVCGLLALVFFVAAPAIEQPQRTASPAVLTDMQRIEDLQTRFNQDAGTPRLILLLSPT